MALKAMETDLLRIVIRFSLRSSGSSTSTKLDDFNEPDPLFRKLVEGILFSRKLILTYHIVILAFIGLFSLRYWTRILARRRKRKRLAPKHEGLRGPHGFNTNGEVSGVLVSAGNIATENGGIYSSGSSTLEGSSSPLHKDDDHMRTPLLNSGNPRTFYPRRTLVSTLRSLLKYQPPPIPIIKKALPDNGSSIVIIFLMAINLWYTFFRINFSISELYIFADRCGLVFVCNLPFLYLLAAKTQPLKFMTGRSYESLNIFHRRLGELLCLEAFLHSCGMVGVWYTLFRPIGFSLLRFLLSRVSLLGLGAFISCELIYFTSLASFRRYCYEFFLAFHVVLQSFALIFVFFHHHSSRPYVGIALGIFLSDRLLFRLAIKSATLEVQTQITEDEESVRLSSNVILNSTSRFMNILGTSITAGWKATDHVFISVSAGSIKQLIQAHPFTVSSAAPLPCDTGANLQLTIRVQGGFTQDLLKLSRLYKTLTVRFDGPYGSSTARSLVEDSSLALLIAGGSGISITWPLLQHLLAIKCMPHSEVIANASSRHQTIVLIWVIREDSHVEWLGRHALADAENMGAHIIVPRATEDFGRPNLATLMKTFVEHEKGKIGVVVSGPDGMIRSVRNTCAGFLRDGRDVDVAVEKFGW